MKSKEKPMNNKTYRMLITTLALCLPLLLLQSTGANREEKSKQSSSPSSAQRLVKTRANFPVKNLASSPQEPASKGKKVAPELQIGSIEDQNGQEEINVDKMSSAGRLAHLAATGKLARAIEKARLRAQGRNSGKNVGVFALAEDDGSGDLEDDDDTEGPAGGQAELSVAVDS